jgi:hypothetical protein
MRQWWSAEELEDQWSLTVSDRQLVANKTGVSRLGFAVLLKFYEIDARFPESSEDVPVEAVVHVAQSVGVDWRAFASYSLTDRSAERHRAQIRESFGFRASTESDVDVLTGWLVDEVAHRGLRAEQLSDVLLDRCRRVQIEPPSAGRISRMVASARHRFDDRFARSTLLRLSSTSRAALDRLVDDDDGRGVLASIRAEPGAIGLDSMFDEIDKLDALRALGLPPDLFAGVSPRVLHEWRNRAAPEAPSALAAHPDHVRVTLLAALCSCRERAITDNLVDLLIGVVHKIGAHVEKRVEREFVAGLRRVSGKTNLLFRMAEAAVDQPDGIVADVLFPIVSEDKLRDLVREYKSSDPAFRQTVKSYLRASYGNHYRRMLPRLLGALTFRSSNTTHRPVLDALELLARHVDSTGHTYPLAETVPVDDVVPPSWRQFVVTVDTKGRSRVNRIAFEICTLQVLRDRLRCKEIWVEARNGGRTLTMISPSTSTPIGSNTTSSCTNHWTPPSLSSRSKPGW